MINLSILHTIRKDLCGNLCTVKEKKRVSNDHKIVNWRALKLEKKKKTSFLEGNFLLTQHAFTFVSNA